MTDAGASAAAKGEARDGEEEGEEGNKPNE
jgi:hypothetical protein